MAPHSQPIRSTSLLRQLIPELRAQFPNATISLPLAVGYHVDHQITYTVANESAGPLLAFYEDVYYVLLDGELERRMADLDNHVVPSTIDMAQTFS